MNTSSTYGRHTYICSKCRSSVKKKMQWGPWKNCCIMEAQQVQQRESPKRSAVLNEHSSGAMTARAAIDTSILTPKESNKSKKDTKQKQNLLGPFMTAQKTTCGALWNWDEGLTEHRKPHLGIAPADVYAWSENYVKTARAP
ncbi:uncharacterized protein LOC134855336 [Symsagittifera roscoffensis]|uniref:uncharacterized protein LOC134855302 n=1 Tax=Symsagittifera roscoffensis TaxID=84072 RepID=UPI00307B43DE